MKNPVLPRRKIQVDGTVYYICGLVHGNPWIKINALFKEKVKDQLKNKNVICEDGFTAWIPNATSMNESEYFGLDNLSFFESFLFWSAFLVSYFFPRSKKKEPEIIPKIRRMDSIEDLIGIREYLFKQYPPEPEGMNLLMAKGNCGAIDSPKGRIPLIIRRYIYEAKTALKYARRNNLGELYIAVGCSHELPLEYLLNHRDILEKYAL